jgi:tetratricopeptide (TPR) repeat protein
MINEVEPVAKALETYEPRDEEDDAFPSILEMAIQQGANPVRGFELMLKKYGLCNAITAMGQSFPHSGEVRHKAVGLLVDTIYRDLRNSLAAHIKELEQEAPPENATIAQLLEERDNIMSDDCYHIDVSHLSSVIQYALELPPGNTTRKVIELCQYGCKLSPRLQPANDPPFDEGYKDYLAFYRTLNSIQTEEGLNHFRMKAENVENSAEQTAPAEVYVHLLSQLGRHQEALAAFGRYLTQANPRHLACPAAPELARRSGDYASFAEICIRRGDAVGYAAAKAAGKS